MAGAVPRTEGGPPLLEVAALRKRFGAMEAVAQVSFTVAEGEILALVGPSGCGKSTTLRMIAGFEAPDSGAIELAGRRVDTLAPERRGIGIVFQDYALFPHLTVLGNVGFAFGDKPRRDHAAEAAPFLDMVGLSGFESRFPDELSGGQQQRVALARTFAARPRLILLDEPFSNLDATLRAATRREIRALLKRSGVGAVFVTHDQEEALSIADRICVMHRGRVEQVGDPISVYRAPRTAFVAGFLGRTNLVRVPVANGRAATALGPVEIETAQEGDLVLSIRPEQIRLRRVGEGVAATVVEREFKGRETTYWIGIGAERYQVDTGTDEWFAPGEEVQASVRSPATVVLD